MPCEDAALQPDKVVRSWDSAQMAIFGEIFLSCIFSEPRVAHYFQSCILNPHIKATSCVEVMVDIQSATAENRWGKKQKPQYENVMACPISQGGHKVLVINSKLWSWSSVTEMSSVWCPGYLFILRAHGIFKIRDWWWLSTWLKPTTARR